MQYINNTKDQIHVSSLKLIESSIIFSLVHNKKAQLLKTLQNFDKTYLHRNGIGANLVAVVVGVSLLLLLVTNRMCTNRNDTAICVVITRPEPLI